MEKEKKDIDKILAQRKVLRTILDKGYKFTVTYSVKKRPNGLLGFLKKKILEQHSEELVIRQATLNTLDRASEVWLRMDAAEAGKAAQNKPYHASGRDMAEGVAIMVLGEKYNAVKGGDEKELKRLTELLYNSLTPSQCNEISVFANANMADFAVSIRLMRMSVTTTPAERIE